MTVVSVSQDFYNPETKLPSAEQRRLSQRPKILFVTDPNQRNEALIANLRDQFEVVEVASLEAALSEISNESVAGVYFDSSEIAGGLHLDTLFQHQCIVKGMPDGVALLDPESRIVWANDCLRDWLGKPTIESSGFFDVFDHPEILGPDFSPFNTSFATGEASSSTIRCNDNRHFRLHSVPFRENDGSTKHLIVTIRDVTAETLQQQKLAAIHKAGIELADLRAEEVFEMQMEDRIELLKSNILHYIKDLLDFDVVEVRLLSNNSDELVPLLAEGIDGKAAARPLFAKPTDNGVTGFVAATGKSYLCEDTLEDPLYIEGCIGAKSSITVPLIQHDQVIGTINVESPEPRKFTESDLQFLEIFSRDIANALNTLELLVAQQANTAQASVEAIHRKVALPVDEILNDAVNVMERYIGHEPDVVQRLQRILRNARDIKQLIHRVGQEMAPTEAVPGFANQAERPVLKECRVLVVDADEAVREAAHNLLERYGCVVETAREGGEAIYMVRNYGGGIQDSSTYDIVIADIRLPDISGYDLLLRLKEFMSPVPLILMTGFGYDPGHSIVKARQAGLIQNAVLYKPFRLDQLLETVESVIATCEQLSKA